MKQKSLFLRYFLICASTVLLSLFILATLLLLAVPRYFKSEKFELLSTNANIAANFTLNNYVSNAYKGLSYNLLDDGYSLIAQASEATMFFLNVDGKTLVCSDKGACVHTTYTVPKETMGEILNGDWQELGLFSGMYKEPYYSVAKPVKLPDGRAIGAVVVSSSSQTLRTLMFDIFRLFAFCALAVLLLSSLLIYAVTTRMVRPLRQMAYATTCFSRGDFTKKISVTDSSEIGQLAVAFNNMSDDLANLENSRRNFIANVSHELKTPMTSIIGFVDGILDGTIPPQKHEYYLGIVSDEAKRLSRMVRSMLSIARIEAGEQTISPTSFDINDTVLKTLFSFEKSIEDKNLSIQGVDLEEKIFVLADEDLIHQVLYNLIENAVKFANEGGEISFNYYPQGTNVFVSVKNTGDGISPEECKKIFERFYKTDRSRNCDKNGFGLGLHIVKSIVNLHGGEVFVTSEEGKYTEFVFRLPIGKKKK